MRAEFYSDTEGKAMGQLKLEDVRPGMVLAAPVMTPDGGTLLLKE